MRRRLPFLAWLLAAAIVVALMVWVIVRVAHQDREIADSRSRAAAAEQDRAVLAADVDKLRGQIEGLGEEPAAPPPEERVDGVGPQGEAGPRGDQGPAGPSGAPGLPGQPGARGLPGETGAQGATGPAGAPGAQGASGPAGPEGVAGMDGTTGPQGAPGTQGPAGPEGPAGPQGPQGEQGPPVGSFTFSVGPLNFRCDDQDGDGQYTCVRV